MFGNNIMISMKDSTYIYTFSNYNHNVTSVPVKHLKDYAIVVSWTIQHGRLI
jgi:hypothetical protein